MSRPRSLALVVAAALTAALAPAALASAAAPAKNDNAKAEHDRIVAYWTPERMKAAKPRDFVRQKDGSFRRVAMPKAKPGGSVAPTSTTGKSWTLESAVKRGVGKVYFEMDGGGWVCSGAVANDGVSETSRSLVLTAGHCAYDETNNLFATNFLFIPDFDSAPNLGLTCADSTPTRFGCWTAAALAVHSGYASATGFNNQATRYDFAFAVMDPNTVGDLDKEVGEFPVTTGVVRGNTMSAFGYPAADPYAGDDLVYCSGAISEDRWNANATWGLGCTMTGGSSGGPWIKGLDLTTGASGALGSLNSYGYVGKAVMYGPKFNDSTKNLYDFAKGLANSVNPISQVYP
jgi:hypothetical protein